MIFVGIDVPRTHSIGYLLNLIEESGKVAIPINLKEASLLTDYAVTARYPGDWEPIGEDEYKHAIALANGVCQWVTSVTEPI